MFKLSIPITKSVQKNADTFVIEGIASSPIIDKHQEKFSSAAIQKMHDCIVNKSLPIRVEHYDLVFTNIGVWKEATILEGDKLYVKGEINTKLSLGKDIKTLLESGEPLCLSIGGHVLDATFEYSKEYEKQIRVFKDVELDEISIVKNPANSEAKIMPIAKSVNWESIEKAGIFSHSTEAQKLIKHYRKTSKTMVTPSEFSKLTVSKGKDKDSKKDKKPYMKFAEWGDSLFGEVHKLFTEQGLVTKDGDIDSEYDQPRMTAEDLQLLAKLMQIMSEVDLPEDGEFPEILQDEEYWANMTEEMQIVLYSRVMVMPHHNVDLSLNRSLVLYQLKRAVDEQSWYRPKDFTVIINHLYRHLKDLAIVKSNSSNLNHTDIMKDKNIQKETTPAVDPAKVQKEEVETPETPEVEAPETPVVETPEVEAPAEEAPVVETPETPEAPEDGGEEVEKSLGKITKAQFSSLTKSVTDLTGIVDTLSKKLEKAEGVAAKVADLEKSLGDACELLNTMASVSKGRKSQARHIAIEKSFQNAHELTTKTEESDKDLSFRDKYTKDLNTRYGLAEEPTA